jgi:hypothetical protein
MEAGIFYEGVDSQIAAQGKQSVYLQGSETTMFERSRRSFLKGSGLAVAGAALADGKALLGEQDAPGAQAVGHTSGADASGGALVELVNVLQGTDSDYYFSRGNTLPIAAMPFGMAHWTLQSRANTPWMFQPADRRVQGFRCTHQLSPGFRTMDMPYLCRSVEMPVRRLINDRRRIGRMRQSWDRTRCA